MIMIAELKDLLGLFNLKDTTLTFHDLTAF